MIEINGEKVEWISIDIETYSSIDLGKCGLYKYAESEDFEILLFGYAINGGEVQVVDLSGGEEIPVEVLKALKDQEVVKWAFNAAFERVCLSAYLGAGFLDPKSWRCSMIWSAYIGLPQSLAGVGVVLSLDRTKIEEGKDLIKYFCSPCKPTQSNGGRTRNLPQDEPDKWVEFKSYNARDVEVELEIQKKLTRFPVPDFVWEEYQLDQIINDRGIGVDMEMVDDAIALDEKSNEELIEKLQELTDLDNPRSVQQMKQWLADNGMEMDSLGKKLVAEVIKTAPSPLKEVLTLRQQISKSSVRKYTKMKESVCNDGRARGMFRFYGAGRTGRFSGRIIQLQNLPQNHLPDLDEARALVRTGDYSIISALYDDVPDLLSQLIRTSFIPTFGKLLFVADFSSVEARVLAWLAGEQWRMDAFHEGKDIYCMSAEAMFHVPVEKHGINSELRQRGKIAELACGYGGATGAMKAMGGLEAGLSEEELQPIVDAWREASPNIVKFWWDVDRAVRQVVENGGVVKMNRLKFRRESGMLIITLPSNRELFYVKPRIGENQYGGTCITYEGTDSGKWKRIESYGPKFVENITQGISRDLLCYAMQSLQQYEIVAHVHDEIIIEADPDTSLEDICEIMGRTPSWAEGLELKADGFVSDYYKKDN